jgi:hypothetical protein
MKTSVSNNVKSFADAAKAASKFTFQAFLVKKTKKQPTAVIKEEKPKQLEIEEILVCSSSSTSAPMQYEEFCGKLFVKDDEAYTYETAKYENIGEETSKKASTKGKRSSYRKSRSGMYKVDIQSSILELDDYTEQETNNVNTNDCQNVKLDTIVEQQPQNPIEVENEMNVEVEEDYFELNGEKRNVKFYRNLVVLETKLLNECSAKWDSCIHEAPEDGLLFKNIKIFSLNL